MQNGVGLARLQHFCGIGKVRPERTELWGTGRATGAEQIFSGPLLVAVMQRGEAEHRIDVMHQVAVVPIAPGWIEAGDGVGAVLKNFGPLFRLTGRHGERGGIFNRQRGARQTVRPFQHGQRLAGRFPVAPQHGRIFQMYFPQQPRPLGIFRIKLAGFFKQPYRQRPRLKAIPRAIDRRLPDNLGVGGIGGDQPVPQGRALFPVARIRQVVKSREQHRPRLSGEVGFGMVLDDAQRERRKTFPQLPFLHRRLV